MFEVSVKLIYQEPDKFLSNSSAEAQKISISGWVRTVRSSASVGFIELNDGTFLKNLQIVLVKLLMRRLITLLIIMLDLITKLNNMKLNQCPHFLKTYYLEMKT